MSEQEIWKDVVGYEGLYKVSNKGNVYSIERKDTIGRKCGGRIMKPKITRDGYLRIGLYKNGIKKSKLIHRLVAEAFIPNPKSFLEVNHKDENKKNNYVENLEWCDTRYNVNYGTRNKRDAKTKSKKVMAINIKTGEVLTFGSTKEAMKKGYFDVSRACRGIYRNGSGNLIGDGHTYRGHKWSYV